MKVGAVDDVGPLGEFLSAAWLVDQVNYHSRAAHRKGRSARLLHSGGLARFIATLSAATMHLLGVGHGVGADGPHLLANFITGLSVVLPAWGASSHAIASLREHERIAGRSRRMSKVLGELADSIHRARTMPVLRQAVAAAEDAVATGNHEWMVSLSLRGLMLPA